MNFYPVKLFRKSISAAHISVCLLYCIIIIVSSNFRWFFLVIILLNQWCASPIRLQFSERDTFLITCAVANIIFFVANFTECLPGITSWYFLAL